jgi:hypothetical protein
VGYPVITQSRLKELLHYNEETGVFTRKTTRGPKAIKGQIAGSENSFGYMTIGIDGKYYKSHRLAWLYVHGEFPSNDIDHINGIRSENMIRNLRVVTVGENMQNQKGPRSNNKTGVLGVCEHSGRYVAQIQVNKKHIHIGMYSTAEEAHEAYLAEKRKIHPACTI